MRLTAICWCFLAFVVSFSYGSKNLIHLNEDTWRDLMKGEWMLEFFAPWCPACKDLSKAWASFADWSKDLNIKVADIDVTANPGLSGRFLVTALPTIYHVKDGVFRAYSGPRDKEDFISFIEEKKWTVVDPVPSWKYPDSFQMGIVAKFFKLSMSVRDAHNYLIEKKGLPSWGSYAIFGMATLLLGCILGFLIVLLIDFVFPTNAAPKAAAVKAQGKDTSSDKKKKQKESKEKKSKDSDVDEGNASQSQSEGENSADETVRQRKKTGDKEKSTDGGNKASEAPSKKKK